MIELIMVISISVLLALFFEEKWFNANTVSLNLLAEELAQNIRLTQYLSLQSNGFWNQIQFFRQNYKIKSSQNETLSPSFLPPQFILPQGTFLIVSQTTLNFDNTGTPYLGSSLQIPLTTAWEIVLENNQGMRKTISVAADTGWVHIE